jgi:cytochrome P450
MTIGTVRAYPFGELDRLMLDPTYAYLREHEPVTRVQMPYGEESWLVTRHADARTVMSDPRFSRTEVLDRDPPRVAEHTNDGGIIAMDPPDHTRLRRLVTKAFTVRRVDALRARTELIANELVDGMMKAEQPVDLVDEFAVPLPVTVICELLGVPYEDRDGFRAWSDALLSTSSLTPQQVMESTGQFLNYMAALVERRRAEPTEDLLGALVRTYDEGDQLADEELIGLAVALLVAGHETTASQLPNFVYTLQTHPDLLDLLKTRPDLIPGAVEELMRWVPLFAAATFPRYATADVELSGGVVVRAGDPVLVATASANRDERVFADPERIDFTRQPNPHIGFGHGVHHCLGAPLARMELQVALATLLERLPQLRFGVPEDEIVWKKGMLMRGPRSLPVIW